MLDRLNLLPAVRQGHLQVEHSVGGNRPNLNQVRYLLLTPHDAAGEDRLGLSSLPDSVKERLPGDTEFQSQWLNSERDAGTDELRQAILESCPGGLSVSVQTNRGICNLNRESPKKKRGEREKAEPQFPNIWRPEERRLVLPTLREIHATTLGNIDQVLEALPEKARIICLHSMDPKSFKTGARPPLTPDTLRQYVAAQGLDSSHKEPRVNDFMTGRKDGPMLADPAMYQELRYVLDEHGRLWVINEPYDTEPGYPDWRYMMKYLGRVSAVDLLKTELCEGDAETFDSRKPVPDSDRVAFMADLHQFAINKVMAA